METLKEKEGKAIQRLKSFNKDDEPYYLCYSGGKDSDTIRILAELANVNFEVHNNHTTVDTPTTVRYIKEVIAKYGDRGFIHYPEKTMWELIVQKKVSTNKTGKILLRRTERKRRQRKKENNRRSLGRIGQQKE